MIDHLTQYTETFDGHCIGFVKAITPVGTPDAVSAVVFSLEGTDRTFSLADPSAILFQGRPARSLPALLTWWAFNTTPIQADIEHDKDGNVTRVLLFPRAG